MYEKQLFVREKQMTHMLEKRMLIMYVT